MIAVDVRELRKTYRVFRKREGLWASITGLFRRDYVPVHAVAGVSFRIEQGEMVAFLGPNGAGKTTTLKLLSGLLYPTSGEATVLGHVPWRREIAYRRRFALVMGQKNQLIWDLPALESFEINRAIFDISRSDYLAVLKELTDLLDLEPVLKKQVRKLSLGERMKCELAAALLHRPKVLFLDEPTIGLDVTMQGRMREFLAEYNKRHGATILLTSHYMADVTALCRRILVIDHGHLIYDGAIDALVERVAPYKHVRIVTRRPILAGELERFGAVLSMDTLEATLVVPRDHTSGVAAELLKALPIEDVTIEDPAVEEIISRIFTEKILT